MEVNQYQIVLVNLDPSVGSEIKKTRPCLVISPNEMNLHLRTVIVAPMTTTEKNYPTRVVLKHEGKLGAAAIDQVRTIDKSRIVKVFGAISKGEITDVKEVIRLTFVE